jgi:hypothetical protein
VTSPEAEASARQRPAETIAGFLAALAIFMSAVGVAYRPLRFIPLALVFAFIAAAMATGRNAKLAALATGVGTVCFVAGMAIAVITENPLF